MAQQTQAPAPKGGQKPQAQAPKPSTTPPAAAAGATPQKSPPAGAAPANGNQPAPSGRGLNVVRDGKTRYWAEMWLTPEQVDALKVLAQNASKGTKVVASELAAELLIPAIVARGGEAAVKVSAERKEKEGKKVEQNAKAIENARKKLEKLGFKVVEAPAATATATEEKADAEDGDDEDGEGDEE